MIGAGALLLEMSVNAMSEAVRRMVGEMRPDVKEAMERVRAALEEDGKVVQNLDNLPAASEDVK